MSSENLVEKDECVKSFQVRIRGLSQPITEGKTIQGDDPAKVFEEALEIQDWPAKEPVIGWEGPDHLAALHIDWHSGGSKAEERRLSVALGHLVPASVRHWTTHGGGGRLIYAASNGLTAHEKAAVAKLIIRQRLEDGTGIWDGISGIQIL